MNWRLGGCGPPWYMEGIAEYLGTHAWSAGRLRLGYMPRNAEEVPKWGRIKIIRDDFKANRALTLPQIFRYDDTAHLKSRALWLELGSLRVFQNHPRWQKAFADLRGRVSERSVGFSQQFHNELNPDWLAVQREWHLFVADLDYGYDIRRSRH